MRTPEDDIEGRMPVWNALQMFFMDTDPAIFLDTMAGVCASSQCTIDEIEEILFQEVRTGCRFNMYAGVVPEWKGFEAESLKKRILKMHRFGRKRPRLMRKHTMEWGNRLKPIIVIRQSSLSVP